VGVETGGQRGVGLTRHEPGGAVIGITVPLVVHRHYVHQYGVSRVCFHPGQAHSHSGEHAPGVTRVILVYIFTLAIESHKSLYNVSAQWGFYAWSHTRYVTTRPTIYIKMGICTSYWYCI
jgi:hypothetical protein